MKKVISMRMELLRYKLSLRLQVNLRSRTTLKGRNKRIARDYIHGYTVDQLAKRYNLTRSSICQILAICKVRQPRWHKMSKTSRQTIFRLQKKGLSKAEIGRRIGVSRERVRQILQQIEAK